MKLDSKKIGLFLKNLEPAEFIYIQHCINFRDSLENLIKKHNLSKKDVCTKFNIPPRKYDDYIKGNYNYSLNDMTSLNYHWIELEKELLKDKAPFKFPKNKKEEINSKK